MEQYLHSKCIIVELILHSGQTGAGKTYSIIGEDCQLNVIVISINQL